MPGMLAVIENATPTHKEYCIVRWTGRSGLSAKCNTWCGEEQSIGTEGVLQMPDCVKLCDGCSTALAAFRAKFIKP